MTDHLDLEAVKERSWRRIYRNSIADDNWRAAFDDANALISEVERLRDGLLQCATAAGEDVSDGIPTWPDVVEWAVRAVRENRETIEADYDALGGLYAACREAELQASRDVERKDEALRAARPYVASVLGTFPNGNREIAALLEEVDCALSESPTETKGENG